jgi:uncharacterized protein YoaH (UPF0181 family)
LHHDNFCFIPDLSIFELTDQAVKQVEIDRIEEVKKEEIASAAAVALLKKERMENHDNDISTNSTNVFEEDDSIPINSKRQEHQFKAAQNQPRLFNSNLSATSTLLNIFEDRPAQFDDIMDDIKHHQQNHDDNNGTDGLYDNNNNITSLYNDDGDLFDQEQHYAIVDDDPMFGSALVEENVDDIIITAKIQNNNAGESTISLHTSDTLVENTIHGQSDNSSMVSAGDAKVNNSTPVTSVKKKIKPNFRSKFKK